MKWLFVLLILSAGIVLGGDSTQQAWGPVTNNAKMSVTIKGGIADIKTNQPFKLLFRVSNTSSNETFCVYRSNAPERDAFFSFVVIAPSGKDISPRATRSFGGSGATVSVPPQQSVELEFDLRKVCKFEEVGTYTAMAKREIWPLDGRKPFRVVSNPLRLTIVPEQWDGKGDGTNASKHW